jgi:hypothetical protein
VDGKEVDDVSEVGEGNVTEAAVMETVVSREYVGSIPSIAASELV